MGIKVKQKGDPRTAGKSHLRTADTFGRLHPQGTIGTRVVANIGVCRDNCQHFLSIFFACFLCYPAEVPPLSLAENRDRRLKSRRFGCPMGSAHGMKREAGAPLGGKADAPARHGKVAPWSRGSSTAAREPGDRPGAIVWRTCGGRVGTCRRAYLRAGVPSISCAGAGGSPQDRPWMRKPAAMEPAT